MAKSTKGKSKNAQEPVNAEEIVQDASDTIAEDVTEIVEGAEVPSDAPVETPEPDVVLEEEIVDEIAELETPAEASAPEPEIIRETIVEKKGGFVPLVLGGIVAAGIGVGSAGYIFPNGLSFGPKPADYTSAIEEQSSRIDQCLNSELGGSVKPE